MPCRGVEPRRAAVGGGYSRRAGFAYWSDDVVMNAYELAEENYNSARTLPARPTDARPGTEAKIKVMRRRWTEGEHLHHPLDRQMDSDDRRAESRIRQFGRLVLKRGART